VDFVVARAVPGDFELEPHLGIPLHANLIFVGYEIAQLIELGFVSSIFWETLFETAEHGSLRRWLRLMEVLW